MPPQSAPASQSQPSVQAAIEALAHQLPDLNRDQVRAMLDSVAGLAWDGAGRLDMKITSAALAEMRAAFNMFRPYHDWPKVTIFGSARTQPDDPLYAQTSEAARLLAQQGWLVVTGAGPGIMAAGAEGAGEDNSLGVSIRLPFEEAPPEQREHDDRVVTMKYFFTRKLMLMKESAGFLAMPGGFGTLDETFELLTLIQTGKAEPAPIVLLDVRGGRFWSRILDVFDGVANANYIDHDDLSLVKVTDDPAEAVRYLLDFHRNYVNRRFVGDLLLLRVRVPPTEHELAELETEFADLKLPGTPPMRVQGPHRVEQSDLDQPELARVAFHFNTRKAARLHQFIERLNTLPSAPAQWRRPNPASGVGNTQSAATP